MARKLSEVYIAAAELIDSGDMRYSCIAVKKAYNKIFGERFQFCESSPAVRYYYSTLGFDRQVDLQRAIEATRLAVGGRDLRVWLLCMVAGVTLAREADESMREGQ